MALMGMGTWDKPGEVITAIIPNNHHVDDVSSFRFSTQDEFIYLYPYDHHLSLLSLYHIMRFKQNYRQL